MGYQVDFNCARTYGQQYRTANCQQNPASDERSSLMAEERKVSWELRNGRAGNIAEAMSYRNQIRARLSQLNGQTNAAQTYAPATQQALPNPVDTQQIRPVSPQGQIQDASLQELEAKRNQAICLKQNLDIAYKQGIVNPEDYAVQNQKLEQFITSIDNKINNSQKSRLTSEISALTGTPNTSTATPAVPQTAPPQAAPPQAAPQAPQLTVEYFLNKYNELKGKKEKHEITEEEYIKEFDKLSSEYKAFKADKAVIEKLEKASTTSQPAAPTVAFGSQTAPQQAAPSTPAEPEKPAEVDYGLPSGQNTALNVFLNNENNKSFTIKDFKKDASLSGVIEAKQALPEIGIENTVKILADGTTLEISENKNAGGFFSNEGPRFKAIITKPDKSKVTVQNSDQKKFYSELYTLSGIIKKVAPVIEPNEAANAFTDLPF